MNKKILITTAILSFFTQIITSFVSSNQIATLNNQLIEKTKQINKIEQENQLLENQYTYLSSLKYINTRYNLKILTPIKQKLDLTQ
ncbi:hypothetical protein KKE45_02595 [Patescibacteria group bacterium]|nr:hypothetical protein [Patescibacteria group bacterium]